MPFDPDPVHFDGSGPLHSIGRRDYSLAANSLPTNP